ncbi:MAG: hypothetical protein H7Y86_08115 [Rhizobacter sp.]|nr:hypothetical protein [Ferruginibacter sp.]
MLYISAGDTSTLFFPEGYHFYKLLLRDPEQISVFFEKGTDISANLLANPRHLGYFADEGNFIVIKITALLCFLGFGKYMVVNLFFALIAFSGIWKLFNFFLDQYPKLGREMAIALLFLPTLTFWSSGILKDSLSIASLGWFTYSAYQLLYHKRNILLNLTILFISIYLFSVVKIYILVAYLPAFFVFLILKNTMLLKSTFSKVFFILTFIAISIAGFTYVTGTMTTAISKYAGEDIVEGISGYQANYAYQGENQDGSYFSLGVEFDPKSPNLLKIAPAAIVATLFRPFIWESRSVSTLLTSLESFSLMLFTIYVLFKIGLLKFIKLIFKYPIILYSLTFSLIFALFIGATTLNFGSLVRYKIPCIPFYLISLFLLLYHQKTDIAALKKTGAQ